MSGFPCRFRNATSRPVEIHRGGEVTILAAGAFLEVEASDPAIEALERSGSLTRHDPAPARPARRRTARRKSAPAAAGGPKRSKSSGDSRGAGKSAAKAPASPSRPEAKGKKSRSTPKRPRADDSGASK